MFGNEHVFPRRLDTNVKTLRSRAEFSVLDQGRYKNTVFISIRPFDLIPILFLLAGVTAQLRKHSNSVDSFWFELGVVHRNHHTVRLRPPVILLDRWLVEASGNSHDVVSFPR